MNDNHKILIVDDKTSNLRFLSNLLTEQGYKVQRAISGQLALNAAIASPPDLILLDILMPEMSGYEVCQRLKANLKTREIPVIFLITLREASEKVKAFELGGVDYITKPFQVEEVLTRIKNQLTIQKLSKQLQEQNARLEQEVETRKQTEEVLRQSWQLIRSVFNSSLNGFTAFSVIRDSQGNIIDFIWLMLNPTGEKILGRKESQVVGKQLLVEMPLNRETGMFEKYVRVVETGEPLETELDYEYENVSACLQIAAVKMDDGFAMTFRDITRRKQAEKALSASERRFRAIFNNSFQFTGLLQPDGTVIEVNQTALDFGGLEHSDIAGEPFWETGYWRKGTGDLEKTRYGASGLSPKQERLKKAIQEAASGHLVRYEIDVRGFGDIILTIDFSLKPVLDETGKIVLLIAEGRDITERKKAEERLRLLESVVVNANDAVLITEAEPINLPGPRIVYVNKGFTRMTGYSPEEVIGKTPRILQGSKTQRTTLDRLRQALESWQSVRVELINYRKDGSEFWVELEIVPVANESGWFTHWVSVQRDITERKQAELEMATAKAALERQIQRVLLLEQITQEIRSSLKPEQIFQTAATQIGKAFRVNRCLIHTYIENPTPQIPFVAEYKQPGLESILSLEIPVIGNPHAQLMLSQDSAISSDNVYADPLLAAVSSLCHKLGLKSMVTVRTSYQGKPNGAMGVHQYDHFRHWTEDEIELLELVAAQVGIAIAQANLLEQETQQRRELAAQNHALEKAKLEAEAANLAKSQFLSKMSHELRTPLNAILGFTQVMDHDDSLTKEQQEHLGIINRSGEHLLELINDILSMSKIEAGQVTLNKNCFDLYRLLDSIEDMLRFKANSKGLQLIFERSLDLPQYIQTDESKLRQVLINLVGNGIKFTQTGSVRLRVRGGDGEMGRWGDGEMERWGDGEMGRWGDGENVQLACPLIPRGNPEFPLSPYPPILPSSSAQSRITFEVEDTGPGIAPDELSTLFNPFVQTQIGRQSMEGTGLGLAISRQFVRIMGGEITVSTQLNRGTIFTFDIQVDLASKADEEAIAIRRRVIGLEPNQPTYRILLVEDALENRQLLLKLLKPLGFEVREAANGQEAIALWESWSPHLILMDILMPVIDGYEATQQIKRMQNSYNTLIIALTASAFEEQREDILRAGCDDFIAKPFRKEILLEKMAQHLKVRYIYEEEQPTLPQIAAPARLTTEDLNVMPPEWVAQLRQAALCIDDLLIVELIKQIPKSQATFAKALTDLVNNFRMDTIIELTQTYISE